MCVCECNAAGKNRHSLTLQDAPAAQVGPLCARHERTDNPRRISSEFPTRHVFSFPWARKAAVPCLLMRDMFVVTLIEKSIKMLLFCSYQWTLQLGFPGKYMCLCPPEIGCNEEKTLSLSWKEFHLRVKAQILQHERVLCIKGAVCQI